GEGVARGKRAAGAGRPVGARPAAGAGPRVLTHVDARGRARMFDFGDKPVTRRVAVARARVRMKPATARAIAAGSVAKGDVLATARIAGIQAAKRTGDLVPLCHPLGLDFVDVRIEVEPRRGLVAIEAEAHVEARTGVEMEAMVAAGIAALVVYDMCKAADRGMVVEEVCLVAKSGGRSGDWRRSR
ncbi:MAG: cyclic pyranopterin monophosphate synthase MoaC, partial [Alphaproteobacteria bacterium]